jgi:hypothetical protein
MKDFNIIADNIYNVNKKGLLIGIGIKMRRIMSWETYKKGKCRQSAYDRSREFITLIACISALGIAILPVLLYKGVPGTCRTRG